MVSQQRRAGDARLIARLGEELLIGTARWAAGSLTAALDRLLASGSSSGTSLQFVRDLVDLVRMREELLEHRPHSLRRVGPKRGGLLIGDPEADVRCADHAGRE